MICILCNSRTKQNKKRSSICIKCIERIVDSTTIVHRCVYCSIAIPKDISHCNLCGNEYDEPEIKIDSCFDYLNEIKRLLQYYKFGEVKSLSYFFVEILKERIKAYYSKAVVVPIPPRPGKIFKKGWDQVLFLLERGRVPFYDILQRKNKVVQKYLDKESRQRNMEGGFSVKGRATIPSKDKEILLIDDISTTGATLSAACRALLDAGYSDVKALVIAKD